MAHTASTDDSNNSSFAAFWSALLFAGLLIAAFNFVKVSSQSHDSSAPHGTEAGHIEQAPAHGAHESPAGPEHEAGH